MSAREDAAKSLAEEVVRSFGGVRLPVRGTSMAPALLPGDLLSIRNAPFDEISVGEIVLFSRNGRLIVHRVVSRVCTPWTSCLITRGDRLAHNDAPIGASDFLGRVTLISRDHRQFEPAATLGGWKRTISPILRASDLATYGYLRLASHLQGLVPGRAGCSL